MKIPSQNSTAGGSVIIVLMVLSLAVTLVGSAVLFSNSQNRLAARQREVTESYAAADGALEYVYALWRNMTRDNGNRALSSGKLGENADIQRLRAGINTTTSPGKELAATGKNFSNVTISRTNPWGGTDSGTPYTVPVEEFPGWNGQAFFYKASVTATGPRNKVNAKVARYFSMRYVPLFQAAIFYMDNLEIHPGALMSVNGLVHSNKDIYAASFNDPAKIQFLDNVSYIGNFYESAQGAYNWTGYNYGENPPPQPTRTPFWKDDLQTPTSAEYQKQLKDLDVNDDGAERIEPFGKGPQALFNTTDSNQDNDGYHEWIEPPVNASTDPKEISGARFYNNADLRIEIDSSKSTGDANRIKVKGPNGADVSATTKTDVEAAISTSTTMYDFRENQGQLGRAKNVTVTSIDMKKLNTALSGLGPNFNGILYVRDVAPQGAGGSEGEKKAIRLHNGAALAKDLTVASVNPVYIQGDYNTGHTTADPSGTSNTAHVPLDVPTNNGGNTNGTESPIVPGYTKKSAAVISDAVTVLSNNWNDADSSAPWYAENRNPQYKRIASHTTVNAAIMCGDVPTNYNNSSKASGGAHNLPRFLEIWRNVDFTYYGSMVQAYTSKTFDSSWQTGQVYWWPNRKWNFDKQFTSNPPPGSTAGLKIFRGRWERL